LSIIVFVLTLQSQLKGGHPGFLVKKCKFFLLAYLNVYLFIHHLSKKNFEIRLGSGPKRDFSKHSKKST